MSDKLNWLIEYEVFSKKASLVITVIGVALLLIMFWKENKENKTYRPKKPNKTTRKPK